MSGWQLFAELVDAQTPFRQLLVPPQRLPFQQPTPSLAGVQLVVLISGRQVAQIFPAGPVHALAKTPSIRQPGMQSPHWQTAPEQHWLSIVQGV